MTGDSSVVIVTVGGLALLAAPWVVAVDAALDAVSRERWHELAELGDARAARLDGLLARRADVQLALRVSAQVLWGLGALAWVALWPLIPWWASALLPALVVVWAELAPRQLALHDPEKAGSRLGGLACAVWALWRPLMRTAPSEPPATESDDDDDDDDEAVLDVAQAALDPERRRRIQEILSFPDRTVAEVLVPRADMICLRADDTWRTAVDLVRRTGRSRVPVIGATADQVIGVLHARDLLRVSAHHPVTDADGSVSQWMHKPLFVGETVKLDEALRELRRARTTLAIVVDEYGGTAGLVTVEDIVEELVGEIHDESDQTGDPTLRPRPAGGWFAPGRLALDDLFRGVGLEWDPDFIPDANTVGGMALSLAGDFPQKGEALLWESETDRLLLRITRLERLSVAEVEVVRQPVDCGADDGDADAAPIELEGDGPWTTPGEWSLAGVERALGYESVDNGGATLGGSATVGDLFAFWTAGFRDAQSVIWRRHRLTAHEAGDGRLSVTWDLNVPAQT